MKAISRFLVFLMIAVLFTGCSPIISGTSSKLINYDYKIRNVYVVYQQPDFSHSHNRVQQGFLTFNFDRMEEFLSKNITPVFKEVGVTAFYQDKFDNKETLPSDSLVLLIVPSNAWASVYKQYGMVTDLTVELKLNLFDPSTKKKIWEGNIKIVNDNSKNGPFNEKKLVSFLTTVIEQMQNDGLIDKKNN